MTKLGNLPTVVAHADWSKDAKKRWVATAIREGKEYRVRAVARVRDASTLLAELLLEGPQPASGLAGFDFPIGLPSAYARLTATEDFPAFLRDSRPDMPFYDVASKVSEVSLTRPFYPHANGKKGEITQVPWLAALGEVTSRDLMRRCERPTSTRRGACPLFWTLGGNQVGKAAISGWRELLLPALRAEKPLVRMWPFDGGLADLLAPSTIVVVETYPAEYYHHLGLDLRQVPGEKKGGKTMQASRAANAGRIRAWAEAHGVLLDAGVVADIEDGFGRSATGEDAFDALIGLLGMLEVLQRGEEPEVGVSPVVARVEGWIFGQASGAEVL